MLQMTQRLRTNSLPGNCRTARFISKLNNATLTAEAGNMGHPVTVSSTANNVEPNKDNLITGNHYPRGILLYSALLGVFVPSGGSKWVIEAPYVLGAARSLGVADGWMVVTYDLGEAVANLVQPFWMLPTLALLGLRARDVMGMTWLVAAVLLPLVLAGCAATASDAPAVSLPPGFSPAAGATVWMKMLAVVEPVETLIFFPFRSAMELMPAPFFAITPTV